MVAEPADVLGPLPDEPPAEEADPGSRTGTRGARLAWALASVAALAVLMAPGVWRTIAAYRLSSDDFVVAFNSCAPYFDIRDWGSWFTQGYSSYFANYPDWPSVGTGFVRPAVNLAFWLQAPLARAIGDSAFLVAAYLAVFVTVFALNAVFRRYTSASPVASAVLSVAVGLSPVWYWSLSSGSSVTNTLALAFSVLALLALDPARGPLPVWRIVLCVVLQVLAIASHETAAVLPVVCVALLFALAPHRPRIAEVAALSLPLAYFVLERVLLDAPGGVYALTSLTPVQVVKRVGGFLLMPALPSRLLDWLVVRDALGAVDASSLVLVTVANVALVWVVASGFRRRERRRAIAMLVAVSAASLPGALMGRDPRFHGLGLVVALVAALYFGLDGLRPRLRTATLALVLIANVALFTAGVTMIQDETAGRLRSAGQFYDSAREAITRERPEKVVLVNDGVGLYGALAMLRMAAWPAQPDVTVLNSCEGRPSEDAATALSASRGVLTVDVRLGQGQQASFLGAVPDFSMPNSGFRYSAVEQEAGVVTGFVAEGRIVEGRTLVLGLDPRTGEALPARTY